MLTDEQIDAFARHENTILTATAYIEGYRELIAQSREATALRKRAEELADALRTTVSVIEQLIPEESARGVANVVLAQAREALRGK